MINLKAVEELVASIQVALFKNSNKHSIGMFKSQFRGSGLTFREHQVYQHGDDVRFIDWKILAKTNNPYVKTFEEERNVAISIFLDIGPSMLLGHYDKSKLMAAIEICSMLFLLAEKTKDKVRVNLFTDKKISLPYESGKAAIVRLISTLMNIGLITENSTIDRLYYQKNEYLQNTKLIESSINQAFFAKNEVVILSDLYYFIDHKKINAFISRPNIHLFQLLTPLDRGERSSFSVSGWSLNGNEKVQSSSHVFTKGNRNWAKSLISPHVKQLNIDERYLDQFVKEMM